MKKQTKAERERQNRICVALWAWAYEQYDDPLVSDAKFDKVCAEINLETSTGNKYLDGWFKANFDKSTGQWVHNHPELDRLDLLYHRLKNKTEIAIKKADDGPANLEDFFS